MWVCAFLSICEHRKLLIPAAQHRSITYAKYLSKEIFLWAQKAAVSEKEASERLPMQILATYSPRHTVYPSMYFTHRTSDYPRLPPIECDRIITYLYVRF